jgi:cyclophilin family peptidyl-prolyl cis-trans isomerase/predicted DsbA family dithiol-disulfide isomerase
VVEQLKADYGDDLRVVYRHFPLITIHDKAQITAEAAEAAGAQGKFWEMHDILYERQAQWGSYQGLSAEQKVKVEQSLISYATTKYGLHSGFILTMGDAKQLTIDHVINAIITEAEAEGLDDLEQLRTDLVNEWQLMQLDIVKETLVNYAEEIGVTDIEQFRNDLENGTYSNKVMADYNAAVATGLSGTPSFIVNQVDFPSQAFGLSYRGLDTFIKLMGLRDNQWYDGPEQVIDPNKQYIATIETDKGNIVVELFGDTAPVNVNSFAFLAEQGWYKNVTFHRVLPGFVAQGGDPTGTGVGFPGYRCDDEVTPKRKFDEAGLVSLANSGPNSNGSQFFITFDAVPQLDPNFTIIGRVIEGMDVAESLTPRDPQQNPDAAAGDKIIDIKIKEKS